MEIVISKNVSNCLCIKNISLYSCRRIAMLRWPWKKKISKTGSVEEVDQPLPTISLSDEMGVEHSPNRQKAKTNTYDELHSRGSLTVPKPSELRHQHIGFSGYGSSTHLSEEKRQRVNSTLSSTSVHSSSSTSYYSADGESPSGIKSLATAKAIDNSSTSVAEPKASKEQLRLEKLEKNLIIVGKKFCECQEQLNTLSSIKIKVAKLEEQLREIMKERGEIQPKIQCVGQNEDTKVCLYFS